MRQFLRHRRLNEITYRPLLILAALLFPLSPASADIVLEPIPATTTVIGAPCCPPAPLAITPPVTVSYYRTAPVYWAPTWYVPSCRSYRAERLLSRELDQAWQRYYRRID